MLAHLNSKVRYYPFLSFLSPGPQPNRIICKTSFLSKEIINFFMLTHSFYAQHARHIFISCDLDVCQCTWEAPHCIYTCTTGGVKLVTIYILSMGVVVATSRNYVDDEYLKEVERARRQLRALISKNRCAPIMLRLAYVFSLLSLLILIVFICCRTHMFKR